MTEYSFDGVNINCSHLVDMLDDNVLLRGSKKDTLCMKIGFVVNIIRGQISNIESLNIDYRKTDDELTMLMNSLVSSSNDLHNLSSQNIYNVSLIQNVSNNAKELKVFAHDNQDVIVNAFETKSHLIYDGLIVVASGLCLGTVSTAILYNFISDQLALSRIGIASSIIFGFMSAVYKRIEYDNEAIHRIEYLDKMFSTMESSVIGVEKQLDDLNG